MQADRKAQEAVAAQAELHQLKSDLATSALAIKERDQQMQEFYDQVCPFPPSSFRFSPTPQHRTRMVEFFPSCCASRLVPRRGKPLLSRLSSYHCGMKLSSESMPFESETKNYSSTLRWYAKADYVTVGNFIEQHKKWWIFSFFGGSLG